MGMRFSGSSPSVARWLHLLGQRWPMAIGPTIAIGISGANFLPFGHRLIEVNGEHVILEPRGIRRKGNPPPE